jgi:hypothetical protein
MADNEPIVFGETGFFSNTKRSINVTDAKRLTVEVCGDYRDLASQKCFPGDNPPAAAWGSGEDVSGYLVESSSLEREEGGRGVLTLNLVKASGPNAAINVTYDIEMQEVQKALRTHPKLRAYKGAMEQIYGFENTDPNLRVIGWDDNGKPQTFQYMDANGEMQEMDNAGAIAYAKAVTAGIETYNIYLPVISKTSTFLKMPGVSFDEETHEITGGTLDRYSTLAQIGCYDDPPIQISGFTNPNEGRWFKSVDKYTQNANGPWSRNEQWVYTNDIDHGWIYGQAIGG